MSWSLLLNIKGILSYSYTISVETTTSITKISWSSDWDDHIWKKWTDWNHCPLYQQWLGQRVLMPTSPVTVLIPLCHPKHFTSHRQIGRYTSRVSSYLNQYCWVCLKGRISSLGRSEMGSQAFLLPPSKKLSLWPEPQSEPQSGDKESNVWPCGKHFKRPWLVLPCGTCWVLWVHDESVCLFHQQVLGCWQLLATPGGTWYYLFHFNVCLDVWSSLLLLPDLFLILRDNGTSLYFEKPNYMWDLCVCICVCGW